MKKITKFLAISLVSSNFIFSSILSHAQHVSFTGTANSPFTNYSELVSKLLKKLKSNDKWWEKNKRTLNYPIEIYQEP